MRAVKRIEIDEDRCEGPSCALCVEVCGRGVLDVKGDEMVIVNLDACDACDECVRVCPNNAIDIHRYRERQLLSAMSRLMKGDEKGLDVARKVVMRGMEAFGDSWYYIKREIENTGRIYRMKNEVGKRTSLKTKTCKICGRKFKTNSDIDVCSECSKRIERRR